MNCVLLDTTAVLAHYLGEPGAEQVHQLLEDTKTEILMCALSLTEFARRLVALGESAADARERALDYAGLCDTIVPVDTALGIRAFELGTGTSARVPLVDTLIAAAAQLSDASLVHRDNHFRALTTVRQFEIPQISS